MSNILPKRSVDSLKASIDTAVRILGVDCKLWVPQNFESIENQDVYKDPSTLQTNMYNTKVLLDWKGDRSRLRKLGIFTEENIPMVCIFYSCIPVIIESYFTIDFRLVPGTISTEKFTVVESLNRYMHDMEILKVFRFAPFRG